MPSPADATVQQSRSAASTSARLVRGSTLLILGRLISKAGNFATQLLLVRYLAKSSYGEFAYALSLVTVVQTAITFGLDRSIPRFLPIFREQQDRPRLLGTIVLTVLTIVGLGSAAAVALYGGMGLAGRLVHDPQSLSLLLVLIFLAPVQALDDVLVGLFAVFARPRAIFFRRYVLAPVLKLATVVLLLLSHSGTVFLASGYVLSSLVGVLIYGYFVLRLLRDQGLLGDGAWRTIVVPWREVFGFTLPLLVTDLVPIAMNTVGVVLLARSWSTSQVADLRAVQPVANLNELVFSGFSTLFTPAASRLFAKGDRDGMNRLYWHAAVWIAVLSFPIFAVTFAASEPLTVFLFGSKYRQAAPILALLSLAYYFNAATGFNGLTLKAFGRVRYMIGISVITMILSVGMSLLLIPRLGALGAGISIMAATSAYNVLKQWGLRLDTGVHLFDWTYARIYGLIAVCASALLLTQRLTSAPAVVSVALAGVMSLVLVVLSARLLEVSGTFPEAMRLPGLRFVFTRGWAAAPLAADRSVSLGTASPPSGMVDGSPPRAG